MNTKHRDSRSQIEFKIPAIKITTWAVLLNSASRALRFPVATITGIVLAYLSSRIVSLIPDLSAVYWFVRISVGFSLGLFVFSLLVALATLRDVERPNLMASLRRGALGSLAVGLITAVPIIGATMLLPDWIWEPAKATWVYEWIDVSIVSLGSILAAAVAPDLLIAWPLSVKFEMPLRDGVWLVWRNVEDGEFSLYRLGIGITSALAIVAFTPFLSLIVVPVVAHLSLVLFESVLVSTRK